MMLRWLKYLAQACHITVVHFLAWYGLNTVIDDITERDDIFVGLVFFGSAIALISFTYCISKLEVPADK